jgi:hypothetical protein
MMTSLQPPVNIMFQSEAVILQAGSKSIGLLTTRGCTIISLRHWLPFKPWNHVTIFLWNFSLHINKSQ